VGKRLLVLTALLGVLASCGYGFPRRPAHIPPDAQTISVLPFQNQTPQIGVEFALAKAIEQVVREHGVLRVVAGEQGDLLLTGKVRDFRSRPVGFSEVDRAQQYEFSLTLDVTLRRGSDGRSLWAGRGLIERFDAAVTPDIVITSSPRFQQGTLNAPELSGLSNIQQAEDQRRQGVLNNLVDPMARSIYSQMMEGF
jgi:Lipopolysaccharide-assembly